MLFFFQLGSTSHHASLMPLPTHTLGNQLLPASCVRSLLAGFQSYLQLLPSQHHHQDFICPLTNDKRPAPWQYPGYLSPARSQASSRQPQ